MDDFLTHIADPSQGSMLLGHIELHSSYRCQPMPIIYGENQSHAKWSYETGVTSKPFRLCLFGIVVDIKLSAKDLSDGMNEYPTIVLGYPNEQHNMVSGNYYNQLLSLREQMCEDVEESNLVTGLQSEVQGGPAKPFALASTILLKGWHPGYIEIGAFIEAVVELQCIDHLRKMPFTIMSMVVCLQPIHRPVEVQDEIIAYWGPIILAKFARCCKKHCTIASNFSTWHHGAQHAYGKYFMSHEIGELQDLQAHGQLTLEYTYRPQQGQQSSFQMDLIRVKELLRKSRSDDVNDTMDFQEVVSGIVETWLFRKGCKEVQLVASSASPLEVVFSFPSTCLMNVFMHRAVYCLFPLLTLVNNIGLINSIDVMPSVQQQSHITYFSRHGYTFLDMPSVAMTINPDTALSFFTYKSKFKYAIAPQLWDSTIAKLNILARLEGQSLLLDIASDTAQDLFTLFFTITEQYPGSTLMMNKEASMPSTSPKPKVSLTLSIPGDVFKPEQQNGFKNWLNMFKASSIFFAIDVLQ
ncbi:hypothetical protein EV368DRAFT_64885 [Lentinula lateritia]|nr:hypothetical protein EV368DRAFT_64885 [Lentinula lateritia]